MVTVIVKTGRFHNIDSGAIISSVNEEVQNFEMTAGSVLL